MNKPFRFGSCFSGIGGLDLGLEWAGMECAWQSEIDPYASKVLAKHWPHVTNYGDIKAIDPATLPPVDLICGGYPCQPFSTAGKRQGAADDRHLWPEMRRIVQGLRPTWVLCENVAGHVSLGLDDVLSDLAQLGYSAQPMLIPSCAVGADHERQRCWIIAHLDGHGKPVRAIDAKMGEAQAVTTHADGSRCAERMPAGADAEDVGRVIEGRGPAIKPASSGPWGWRHRPLMGRGIHGIPHRLDRVRALGNAVDPRAAYEIGRAIMAASLVDLGA